MFKSRYKKGQGCSREVKRLFQCGHQGTGKMHSRLKEHFYLLPGYLNDVHLFCEACTSCATRKTPAPKNWAPLQWVQTGYAMEVRSSYGSDWTLPKVADYQYQISSIVWSIAWVNDFKCLSSWQVSSRKDSEVWQAQAWQAGNQTYRVCQSSVSREMKIQFFKRP